MDVCKRAITQRGAQAREESFRDVKGMMQSARAVGNWASEKGQSLKECLKPYVKIPDIRRGMCQAHAGALRSSMKGQLLNQVYI